MTSLNKTGSACLVLGPLLGVVSMVLARTVSHRAADQAAAFTAHPTASQIGLGINALAAVLLTAGVVWLALTTYARAPRLAATGGVLGVLGMFAIVFDDAVHLSGALVVRGLDPARAADLLGPLSSGGVLAVGPLSELADVGVILLALATLRLGVSRWAVAAICVGVVVEGAGFAIGTRYLPAVGFAIALAGYAAVVHTLAGRTVQSASSLPSPAITG
ncbi:MAG TPA: hypothetical protein VFJ19_07645 [Nocardioidaceae bacterium]|nr:hypothetical protein [Nocardioidaceae bacterium]